MKLKRREATFLRDNSQLDEAGDAGMSQAGKLWAQKKVAWQFITPSDRKTPQTRLFPGI
jgi:hypothetical protein